MEPSTTAHLSVIDVMETLDDERIVAVRPSTVRALGGNMALAALLQQLKFRETARGVELWIGSGGEHWHAAPAEELAADLGLSPKQAGNLLRSAVSAGYVASFQPHKAKYDQRVFVRLEKLRFPIRPTDVPDSSNLDIPDREHPPIRGEINNEGATASGLNAQPVPLASGAPLASGLFVLDETDSTQSADTLTPSKAIADSRSSARGVRARGDNAEKVEFESFWAAYPRRGLTRGNKSAAFAQWRKLPWGAQGAATAFLPTYRTIAGDYPKDAERYLRGRLWAELDVGAAPAPDSRAAAAWEKPGDPGEVCGVTAKGTPVVVIGERMIWRWSGSAWYVMTPPRPGETPRWVSHDYSRAEPSAAWPTAVVALPGWARG